MNKIVLILSMVTLCFSAEPSAIGTETVHDNFKPAGLQIDGSGWLKTRSKDAAIIGKIGFFIWDGVQFSTSLGASTKQLDTEMRTVELVYENEEYHNDIKKYKAFTRISELYTKADAAYFWGYKRGKTDRLVHSIGMAVKFGIQKVTPLKFEDDSTILIPGDVKKPHTDLVFQPSGPHYQLYWFITPAIAPNIKVEFAGLAIPDLTLGFSYFIPSKKLVLIHREKKERRESKKEQRVKDESTEKLSDSSESVQ